MWRASSPQRQSEHLQSSKSYAGALGCRYDGWRLVRSGRARCCLQPPSNACQSRLLVSSEGDRKHVDNRRRLRSKGVGQKCGCIGDVHVSYNPVPSRNSSILRVREPYIALRPICCITFTNQKLSHGGCLALYKLWNNAYVVCILRRKTQQHLP